MVVLAGKVLGSVNKDGGKGFLANGVLARRLFTRTACAMRR